MDRALFRRRRRGRHHPHPRDRIRAGRHRAKSIEAPEGAGIELRHYRRGRGSAKREGGEEVYLEQGGAPARRSRLSGRRRICRRRSSSRSASPFSGTSSGAARRSRSIASWPRSSESTPIDLVARGDFGRMVALQNNQIDLRADLATPWPVPKLVDPARRSRRDSQTDGNFVRRSEVDT